MLKQIAAVVLLNFRNLPSRFWPSMVIVVGMACVVGVLISMLSLTTGYVTAELQAGDPGRAIVIANGIENENQSSLTRDQAAIIIEGPGIKRDADGSTVADAEILLSTPASQNTGLKTSLQIRGFGSKGLELHPELKLMTGRMFRPGSRELIVGHAIQNQFQEMEIGDKVILPDGQWPIVGVFSTGGDVLESGLIADRDTLMGATRRTNFNSVLARLDSAPASMGKLKSALLDNPALPVIAERQSTYYDHLSAGNAVLFSAVAYAVGVIMATGAMFGGINIMYAAVRSRTREIGILRAIGFGAVPVAISVLTETLFLALTGACIGSAIAWLVFNDSQKAYFGTVFDLKVTPGLIGMGVVWASVVALVSGLLPSIRAVRMRVVEALRDA